MVRRGGVRRNYCIDFIDLCNELWCFFFLDEELRRVSVCVCVCARARAALACVCACVCVCVCVCDDKQNLKRVFKSELVGSFV